ncbi:class I SAM-dependent methyltransferase [Microvirga arsenatis]|uniref:Methyltransferase domain-containing protein n=1 Tax=Microvirga arsenatis TaxID=2692265 RepID=A0ABW9Z2D6_9HYPH|nr:class I SAM-dependent methyltransferase [Microvirga arsenatis]NBJ12667.1 methyltransferase domain-containing protein [Microvirga arsenatis]NBJ26585.1 methyltransferase domain-containing protein [Microvirga arsenatis]
MNWRDYWDQDTPIYTGERHKLLHYRLIANDIVGLIPSPDAAVLDYGCGEALFADKVAARCARLYLSDAAPLVRERLNERFGDNERITVLSTDDVANLPDASLDLIVVNSLVQYLSLDEFRALLKLARDKLKEDGRLILGDIIPPDISPLTDAKALLSFAWQGGFVRSAVMGLARTAFSEYRKIREEVGLAQYGEEEIVDLLEDAGFRPERAPRNLGHNQARMTFVGRPAAAVS